MDLSEQTIRQVASDPAARTLIDFFQKNKMELGLDQAAVYYRFPIYKEDDHVIATDILLVSPNHGVLVFGLCSASKDRVRAAILETDGALDLVFNHLYSRCVRLFALIEY